MTDFNTKLSISLFLDLRRKKINGLYPVKIRIYDPSIQKAKHYPTPFDMSQTDFKKSTGERPRGNYKDLQLELYAQIRKYQDLANKLDPFTFSGLNRLLNKGKIDSENVFDHLDAKHDDYEAQGRIGTAKTFKTTANSMKAYMQTIRKRNSEFLRFREIDKDWLEGYEKFMLENKRSLSTVGSYMRTLRIVFNDVAKHNPAVHNYYPFKKGIYTIPATKKAKRALSKVQIKKLYDYEPKTKGEQFAKDMWFLSYSSFGLNMSDIVRLQKKDMSTDHITVYRRKTINSRKGNLTPIIIPVTDHWKVALKRYHATKNSTYLFGFAKKSMSEAELQRKIHWLNRKVRRNLKSIASRIDLPSNLSQQWARHSFSTQAIQNGASVEMVSSSFGHADIKTTMAYFDGFADEQKKEMINKLMSF